MKFKEGNRIPYRHDHGGHQGIPAGVEFEAELFVPDMLKLTGHGYGLLTRGSRTSYGNGALYAWGPWIRSYITRRLKRKRL